MKVSQVTMTPGEAEQLLLLNPDTNRRLGVRRVSQLADVIQRGEWRLTHQPIALDSDGVLLDGQHRLAAIAKAGKPVPIMLAKDCDPGTFTVIDIGARRSPGDILHGAGYMDGTNLAAAARLYVGYREDLLGLAPWPAVGGRIGRTDTITPQVILEAVDKHPALRDLSPVAARIAKGIGRYGFRCGILTSVVVLAEDSPLWDQLSAPWIAGLADGADLPPGSPMLAWRKWALIPQRRSRPEVMATLLKAWNVWQDPGGFMQQAKVQRGERMPSVKVPRALRA